MKRLTLLTLSALCFSSLLNAKTVVLDEQKIRQSSLNAKTVVLDEQKIRECLIKGGASEEEATDQASAAVAHHEQIKSVK